MARHMALIKNAGSESRIELNIQLQGISEMLFCNIVHIQCIDWMLQMHCSSGATVTVFNGVGTILEALPFFM